MKLFTAFLLLLPILVLSAGRDGDEHVEVDGSQDHRRLPHEVRAKFMSRSKRSSAPSSAPSPAPNDSKRSSMSSGGKGKSTSSGSKGSGSETSKGSGSATSKGSDTSASKGSDTPASKGSSGGSISKVGSTTNPSPKKGGDMGNGSRRRLSELSTIDMPSDQPSDLPSSA